MRSIASALLVTIPLAGCVSMYQRPAGQDRAASIEFRANDLSVFPIVEPGWHEFTSFGNSNCTAGPGDGRLAFLMRGRLEENASLHAGRPIFIRAAFTRHVIAPEGAPLPPYGYYVSGKDVCLNMVSFTPEAGHRYSARQTHGPQCTLSLLDLDTGREPPTLERHRPGDNCRLYKNATGLPSLVKP